MPTYLIQGARLDPEDPRFRDAVIDAYRLRHRPVCLCTESGAEMYVAQLGSHFVLKRMPLTGDRHAPDCRSSSELPISCPPRTQAAVAGPQAGTTSIRLAFAMSQGDPSDGSTRRTTRDVDAPESERLSLGGLLTYLWLRASLTQWHPAFAGKRTWLVVRKRLLEAAQQTLVGSRPLSERLYIPERFRPDDRAPIEARMTNAWRAACKGPAPQRRLVLLIGEAKQIGPGRGGGYLVLRHLPGRVFVLDPGAYAFICQRFGRELSLWGASDQVRLMVIATFRPRDMDPEIFELSLMPVTPHWLPIPAERQTALAPFRTFTVSPRTLVPATMRRHAG